MNIVFYLQGVGTEFHEEKSLQEPIGTPLESISDEIRIII